MIVEIKERELNPPDVKPVQTFDDLSEDEQAEILDDIYIANDIGDILSEMHDNEMLHEIISIVHLAWVERNGLSDIGHDATDLCEDIVRAWDKALRRTFKKEAEEMVQHVVAQRLAMLDDDERI